MKQVNTNKIGIFYDPLINEGSFNDRHLEQIREAAPHADIIVVKDSDSKNDKTLAGCIDTEIFFGTDIKDWIKILSKDDDDEHLSWRVAGTGKNSNQVSASRNLYWTQQVMTALAPADGIIINETESVIFSFSASSLAQSPIVQLSTTGDFNDKKSLLTLKVNKGQTQTELTAEK